MKNWDYAREIYKDLEQEMRNAIQELSKNEPPAKSLQLVEFVEFYFSAKKGVFTNNFNMLREFSPDFLQGTQK